MSKSPLTSETPGIWGASATVEDINKLSENTIHTALGIEFITLGKDYLEATMPVDERTRQPAKLLHGGASAVLAESLGSVASLLVTSFKKACVGIELNISHLSYTREGSVTGKATPIRLGKKIHVWRIQIHENTSSHRLISEARLTVMIRDAGQNLN